MTKETLILNDPVNPFQAEVLVQRSASGDVVSARFELSAMPRIEHLLLGRPVVDIPKIVQRLCGICPVTHHLAGMRALDGLFGFAELPETAVAVRNLLHFGSVLDAVAPKFFDVDREAAVQFKRLGKEAMAAAGCLGHFPDVAVPGGVRAAANPELVESLVLRLDGVFAAAKALISEVTVRGERFVLPVELPGLVLEDGEGFWDPLGTMVRSGVGFLFPVSDWSNRVEETRVGSTWPRPQVLDPEGTFGPYHVGPLAQVQAGSRLKTFSSGSSQVLWANKAGIRVAMALQLWVAVDAIRGLCDRPELVSGPVVGESGGVRRVGVGVVDGPRGLLSHRYVADESGMLVDCQILTPTAQNEPWLGAMLTQIMGSDGSVAAIEDAIRTADPCLPCSSAPPGMMGVVIEEEGE